MYRIFFALIVSMALVAPMSFSMSSPLLSDAFAAAKVASKDKTAAESPKASDSKKADKKAKSSAKVKKSKKSAAPQAS